MIPNLTKKRSLCISGYKPFQKSGYHKNRDQSYNYLAPRIAPCRNDSIGNTFWETYNYTITSKFLPLRQLLLQISHMFHEPILWLSSQLRSPDRLRMHEMYLTSLHFSTWQIRNLQELKRPIQIPGKRLLHCLKVIPKNISTWFILLYSGSPFWILDNDIFT